MIDTCSAQHLPRYVHFPRAISVGFAPTAAQQAHLERLRAVDPSPKANKSFDDCLAADIQLSRGKKRSNTN